MREVGRVAAGAAARAGRAAGRTAGGFSVAASEQGEGAGRVEAAAVPALGLGLLAVQEGGGREARDQAARRRADSMLQELRSLQREMLSGAVDRGRLERLASLQSGDEAADPILKDVVQAIVLRARVELARRGWNDLVSGK